MAQTTRKVNVYDITGGCDETINDQTAHDKAYEDG
jgi:hypothetical protein